MSKSDNGGRRKRADDRTLADKIGGIVIVLSVIFGVAAWALSEPDNGSTQREDGGGQSGSCQENHRQSQDELEFRTRSPLFYAGREACKEAAAEEAM